MDITEKDYELWGSAHWWSSEITAASAKFLGISELFDVSKKAKLIALFFLKQIQSSRPTRMSLFHGSAMPPKRLSGFVQGDVVRLPLMALSDDEDAARRFSSGNDQSVLLKFHKGILATRYHENEWITAGDFLVSNVSRTVDPFWKTPLIKITLKTNGPATQMRGDGMVRFL